MLLHKTFAVEFIFEKQVYVDIDNKNKSSKFCMSVLIYLSGFLKTVLEN